MSHRNTVFSQLLELIPRHEFSKLAAEHHQGQRFRQTSRWDQFIAMVSGQLTGHLSLRDVVQNLEAQKPHLYHLGSRGIARSTLARLNERQPYLLYEALFYQLYDRCRRVSPSHGFKFKHRLFSFDSSYIHLCEHAFPWAQYAKSKGGIKIHLGLDHAGELPGLVYISAGNEHDIQTGRQARFSKGSIVVFDRGYVDHRFFQSLDDQKVFFVVRLKKGNMVLCPQPNPATSKRVGLQDEIVYLAKKKHPKEIIGPYRRITVRDEETNKTYYFLTNHMTLSAKTVSDLYQHRWRIEVFFKWIKQNLKIKAFLGTTPNAVRTQIWIALCVALLLQYIRFISKSPFTLRQILQRLSLSLFLKSDVIETLRLPKPPNHLQQQLQGALL